MSETGSDARDERDIQMAWTHQVLSAFRDGQLLTAIPAQRKKRLVILEWLIEDFAWGRRYSEAEVNLILWRRHSDTASLRRELVDHGFLRRERGVYWREAQAASETTWTSETTSVTES